MKELLRYEGDRVADMGSPREIIKAAYRYYDCMDEQIWLQMLRDRNDTTHIYDAELASRLVQVVIETYIPEFQKFDAEVRERYGALIGEGEPNTL